jgi:hypothetical protein
MEPDPLQHLERFALLAAAVLVGLTALVLLLVLLD